MAVKIRLKRMGKIRAPFYRIVVADSRTKRDGRVIEEIGKYHPTEEPSVIEIKSDRALYWLGVGAQPTEQVAALLKLTGDWGTFKGEKGAKNSVKLAEAKPEFQADEKKKPVLKPKAEVPAKTEKADKADKPEKAAKAEEAADADAAADAPKDDVKSEEKADEAKAEEPKDAAKAEEKAEEPESDAKADDTVDESKSDADKPADDAKA